MTLPRHPVSPCCVGHHVHGQPGCVWPSTVPADDVLLALGKAVWESLTGDDAVYVKFWDDQIVTIDGDVALPAEVGAIIRAVRARS